MDATHDQFVELFLRNQNRVYRYVLTLVPNAADAEELFQQTSLTLWKTWERFDLQQDFVRWACGIAHNHVRNFIRKRHAGKVLLSEEALDQLAELRLEREGWLEERRLALAACLEKLPATDRRLIESCYSGDASIRTLAEREGHTPNVLYKTLRRIRTALFDCVTRALALEPG